MTETQKLNVVDTAMKTGFIKKQVQVVLNKTELLSILTELLGDGNQVVQRAVQTKLNGKFPQFPDFPIVSLGDIDEKGSTVVTLKQAIPQRTVVAEFKANEDSEPEETEETED